MDYKLIKENFERATAKLTEEAAEFTEEEKEALGFLQVAINMFRGGQYGFASDKLEPLGTSTNAKVMEINTLAEQLVQELQELEEKIVKSQMPEQVEKVARKELNRMQKIPSQSPEYSVSRTYLDWLVDLPWGKSSKCKKTRNSRNLNRNSHQYFKHT